MKTRLVFLGLLFTVLNCFSQQDAQFTQYMYNTINVNPAYAGSRDAVSVLLLYRTQWVGLEGAPQTGTFSINMPIENTKLGLGISAINDRIGPADETNFAVDVSYTINTSESYKLAFGVKASANILNVDFTKLSIFNNLDPKFQYNIDNKFSPNIGAGAYWYSDKTYIGVSVPNMLETKHFDRTIDETATSFTAKERMTLYVIGGKVFDLSDKVKFKPAFLTKIVSGAPLQVDFSGNFMYDDKFVLGAAYRWDAAFSLLAGFQVNKSLYIGYGYDMDTTKLASYNSGSHEIFVRYEFIKNLERIISPRFF